MNGLASRGKLAPSGGSSAYQVARMAGGFRPLGFHLRDQLQTGHAWHRLISDHEVDGNGLPQERQRLPTGVRLKDLVAEVFKHGHHVCQDEIIIVNREDQ